MKLYEQVVRLVSPLLFQETMVRDSQGRPVELKRGVDIQSLAALFHTQEAMERFLLLLWKQLRRLGFVPKIYLSQGKPHLTAISDIHLPSDLSDHEAFVLMVVMSLAKKSGDIPWKEVEEEIGGLMIEKFNARKVLDLLLYRGLVIKTSLNPLKVAVGGLFYVEFPEIAEHELRALMDYHFLLGVRKDE